MSPMIGTGPETGRRATGLWQVTVAILVLAVTMVSPHSADAASPTVPTPLDSSLTRYARELLLEKSGAVLPGTADPGMRLIAPTAAQVAAKNSGASVGPDGSTMASELAAASSASLSTTYTRWIIEPRGGSWFDGDPGINGWYTDNNYFNECTDGAAAVAMRYWQSKYGFPNVSGMAGYAKEPYTSWPAGYPTFRSQSVGSYFAGTSIFDGYTANARGYIQYLSMKVSTPGLAHPGIDEYFNPTTGAQEYRQQGGTPSKLIAALNEESRQTFWAWVPWSTQYLATVLRNHVGTDIASGLPVIVMVDASLLPNWTGEAQGLVQHAVSIVGYNDSSGTYTYLDSCGTVCNPRAGNQNGGIYTISQTTMANAMIEGVGAGFAW